MRKSIAVILLVTIAAVASEARAVTMAWTPVGNPGNAADPATGSVYGAVGYSYNIGTYDVTVSQYVEFLNAKDPTGADPLGLYNSSMSAGYGAGINYNSGGTDGSLYSAKPGDGNHPVNFVNFFDTLRFANWMNNGQGTGSTETGAYTLLGGTPTPSNADTVGRNTDATIFISSENEWYKAAYFNPATSSYYTYGTSSNTLPTASAPTATPNSANYSSAAGYLTDVGAYTGTTSPYGVYDMVGGVLNWDETLYYGGSARGVRGSSFLDGPAAVSSSLYYGGQGTSDTGAAIGFRLVSVSTPEPSTGVLAIIAFGVLCWWRKRFK